MNPEPLRDTNVTSALRRKDQLITITAGRNTYIGLLGSNTATAHAEWREPPA